LAFLSFTTIKDALVKQLLQDHANGLIDWSEPTSLPLRPA